MQINYNYTKCDMYDIYKGVQCKIYKEKLPAKYKNIRSYTGKLNGYGGDFNNDFTRNWGQ